MHANEFVESYIDAWNHQDPVAIANHLAKGGIYCDVPENARRSRSELIVSLTDFFAKYRHRYELIGDILVSNDTIAYQYRMFAPDSVGQHPAIDSFRGAEFITLQGDAAMMIMDYYDMPGTSRPAGLVAATGRRRIERKYAKSGLSDAQLNRYKRQLERAMATDQIFLHSDLTLPRLAETIGCTVNHLSQVINAGFGMSFFDYVNQHRVERARQLLAQREGRSDAILNIAFSVGFNSNSAFYAAFKKCVGMTPAQFRRAQRERHH